MEPRGECGEGTSRVTTPGGSLSVSIWVVTIQHPTGQRVQHVHRRWLHQVPQGASLYHHCSRHYPW